jgi:Cd2+/Zn2+-exporting ATPase
MVAAISAAARLGVLVKSVTDLEGARNLTAMVFDKTGTLTTGQLEVTRLTPAEGVEGAELLQAAASAEQRSRHPVARAVFEVARKAKLHLTDPNEFHEEAGKGVRATIDGQTTLVGRGNWITQELHDEHIRQQVEQAIADPEAEGLSTLFVVRNGRFLGWLGLADNTRPQAAGAMDDLREMGLKRLIIVTGDRESVAKRVAAQMHTEYRAEVLPHEKLEMVDDLKGRGHRVAVIGDGVNDAPALKAGDISIAMGAAGSDVAIHSASIALMNNNLNRIPFLVRLSRQTSAVIKQNMAIGGGFILLFLVIAGTGHIPPVVAALLHVVSSLIVVFNSARLVRCGEDIEQAEHQALEASQAKAQKADDTHAGASPAIA